MWNPQCGADKDVELPNVVPIRMRSSQYGTSFSWFYCIGHPYGSPNLQSNQMPAPDQNIQFLSYSVWSPQGGTPNVEPIMTWSPQCGVSNVEPTWLTLATGLAAVGRKGKTQCGSQGVDSCNRADCSWPKRECMMRFSRAGLLAILGFCT